MKITDLSAVNAVLNAISTVFLITGYVYVKRGRQDIHKRFMLAALTSSALFLASYLVYHYQVGSVPYPYHDWTRVLYFIILVPHIILAGIMTPFILIAVWFALKGRTERHRKLVRWVWPVWMYVSVSGVMIYLMLYHL